MNNNNDLYFNYYDLLSNLILGMVAFYGLWKLLFPNLIISEWMIIPAGYLIGYLLNTLSSILEPFFFWTIGGKPSEKLLNPVNGRNWTGIKTAKFYFPQESIKKLKEDMGDNEASADKMFRYAMGVINSKTNTRVSFFNGHYAFARVALTLVIIAIIVVEWHYFKLWYSWVLSFFVLFLTWNRYRQRSYYLAIEVLNEYLISK